MLLTSPGSVLGQYEQTNFWRYRFIQNPKQLQKYVIDSFLPSGDAAFAEQTKTQTLAPNLNTADYEIDGSPIISVQYELKRTFAFAEHYLFRKGCAARKSIRRHQGADRIFCDKQPGAGEECE